jgi:hypothetical protein
LSRARVIASARIAAAPRRLYDVLADYRHGHGQILPKRFSDLTVERGGFGAGTIIRFRLRIGGRTQTFRAAITEPDPGRVLVETNLEGKVAITTFTVAAEGLGEMSTVTIATELSVRGGILGAIERLLKTKALQPLYREELQRLAAFVSAPVPSFAGEGRHQALSLL